MNPILDGILAMEGGWSNNSKDSGGATNWGITETVARAHGYTGEMQALTRFEAYAILENDYWIKPGFEQIARFSYPISFELCDAAVNIGPHHPCTWLQRWLNAFNRQAQRYEDIKTDGVIGPRTLAALQQFLHWRGEEGEKTLVKALNCSQGAYYLEITEKRSKNEEFIYGWIRNRVT